MFFSCFGMSDIVIASELYTINEFSINRWRDGSGIAKSSDFLCSVSVVGAGDNHGRVLSPMRL
jgi:hypothetical protein